MQYYKLNFDHVSWHSGCFRKEPQRWRHLLHRLKTKFNIGRPRLALCHRFFLGLLTAVCHAAQLSQRSKGKTKLIKIVQRHRLFYVSSFLCTRSRKVICMNMQLRFMMISASKLKSVTFILTCLLSCQLTIAFNK